MKYSSKLDIISLVCKYLCDKLHHTTMTRFRTTIESPKSKHCITHKNNLLLTGSCFASNIGAMLAERKFNIDINPFGVLYNPLSISTMFTRVIDGQPFTQESPEVFEHC